MLFLRGLLAPSPPWGPAEGLGEARAAAWRRGRLAARRQGRRGLQAAPPLLCEMEEAERKRGRHFPASTLAPGRAPCGLGLG